MFKKLFNIKTAVLLLLLFVLFFHRLELGGMLCDLFSLFGLVCS